MKPKEWLLKNGHIDSIGRGRISREQIDLVTEAGKSTYIEGYSHTAEITPVAKHRVSVDKPVLDGDTPIVELAPYVYAPGVWQAVGYVDGKRVVSDTKQACEHGYSVCGHESIGCTIQTKYGPMVIQSMERI